MKTSVGDPSTSAKKEVEHTHSINSYLNSPQNPIHSTVSVANHLMESNAFQKSSVISALGTIALRPNPTTNSLVRQKFPSIHWTCKKVIWLGAIRSGSITLSLSSIAFAISLYATPMQEIGR